MADVAPTSPTTKEKIQQFYLATQPTVPPAHGREEISVFDGAADGDKTTLTPTCPDEPTWQKPAYSTTGSGCAPYGEISGIGGLYVNNYYLDSITRTKQPLTYAVKLNMISTCRDSSSPPIDDQCIVTLTEGREPAIACNSKYRTSDLAQMTSPVDSILSRLKDYRATVEKNKGCTPKK